MLCWAEVRGSTTADSVDEIRKLSLLSDCQTAACVGGLVCHLATPEEITFAAGIYDLSDNEVQEPSLLGAALLIFGAEDKYELEEACLPLFSMTHWPPEDQDAYGASQTEAEKNLVVLKRIDDWAAEIETNQATEN